MLARNLCKTLFVLLVPAFAVAGQQAPAPRVVDLTAPDGLKLKGTFSATAASGPGVLLLHQCNRQRKVWDDLARRMTAAGMNVKTVDLRGYGDSEGTPIDKLSPEEINVVFNEKMPLDVETAYKFLVAQPTVSAGILVVGGASCGVNQSVHLAMKHPEIKALVLLSEITDIHGRSAFAQGRPGERFAERLAGDPISRRARAARRRGQRRTALRRSLWQKSDWRCGSRGGPQPHRL